MSRRGAEQLTNYSEPETKKALQKENGGLYLPAKLDMDPELIDKLRGKKKGSITHRNIGKIRNFIEEYNDRVPGQKPGKGLLLDPSYSQRSSDLGCKVWRFRLGEFRVFAYEDEANTAIVYDIEAKSNDVRY